MAGCTDVDGSVSVPKGVDLHVTVTLHKVNGETIAGKPLLSVVLLQPTHPP
jgi:hypothetical protein